MDMIKVSLHEKVIPLQFFYVRNVDWQLHVPMTSMKLLRLYSQIHIVAVGDINWYIELLALSANLLYVCQCTCCFHPVVIIPVFGKVY